MVTPILSEITLHINELSILIKTQILIQIFKNDPTNFHLKNMCFMFKGAKGQKKYASHKPKRAKVATVISEKRII